MCAQIHLAELNKIWIDSNAQCGVAGVDTLIRMSPTDPWLQRVTLGVMDESHHLLTKNKWGRAVSMFPHAKWLGVTATPNRADGYGLGRHADGIMDAMVLAPNMRALIEMGYFDRLPDLRAEVGSRSHKRSDLGRWRFQSRTAARRGPQVTHHR